MLNKSPTLAAILAVGLFAAPVDAAIYTYQILDVPRPANPSLNYGIRIDDYDLIFSFENGASAKLVYDDVARTAVISGTVRESYSEPGNWNLFREIWDITYTMTNVDDTRNGTFIDNAGNGTGSISRGNTTYSFGMPKSNGASGFFFLADAGNYAAATGFGGAGWFDPDPNIYESNKTNDFIYTAELVGVEGGPASTIPLPAAGWLLLGGVMGLGAMSRRRRAAL